MVTAITTLLIVIILFLYPRYMPVLRMNEWNADDLISPDENMAVVDIRDFRISSRGTLNSSHQIPLPYLRRNAGEIPDKEIVIIASDSVEKNLSIRALRSRGFRVTGYYLADRRVKECAV